MRLAFAKRYSGLTSRPKQARAAAAGGSSRTGSYSAQMARGNLRRSWPSRRARVGEDDSLARKARPSPSFAAAPCPTAASRAAMSADVAAAPFTVCVVARSGS